MEDKSSTDTVHLPRMPSEVEPTRTLASSPSVSPKVESNKDAVKPESSSTQDTPRFYVEPAPNAASSETPYEGEELAANAEYNYSPGGNYVEGAGKRIPRPPNAFILYRRVKQTLIVKMYEGIANNDVSKIVGEMWRNEPEEVKDKYRRLADKAKDDHTRRFPNYRYKPRKSNKKKKKRELANPEEVKKAADLANFVDNQNVSPNRDQLMPPPYAFAPPGAQMQYMAPPGGYYGEPAMYVAYGDPQAQLSPRMDPYGNATSPSIGRPDRSPEMQAVGQRGDGAMPPYNDQPRYAQMNPASMGVQMAHPAQAPGYPMIDPLYLGHAQHYPPSSPGDGDMMRHAGAMLAQYSQPTQ